MTTTTISRDEAVAMTSTPKRIQGKVKGKCLICDERPAQIGCYCKPCKQQSAKGIRMAREAKVLAKPQLYATWRGMAIGFVFNPDTETFRAQRCNRNIDRLPKKILINLDAYVKGYTREQVKKIKAAIVTLHRV